MKRIFLTLFALLLIGAVAFFGARMHTGNSLIPSSGAALSEGSNILGISDEDSDGSSSQAPEPTDSIDEPKDEAAEAPSPEPTEAVPSPEVSDTPNDETSETPSPEATEAPGSDVSQTPSPDPAETPTGGIPEQPDASEEPIEEATASPAREPTENPEATEAPIIENDVRDSDNSDDFYFAFFDVLTEGKVKAAIPGLIVRFHGYINAIDPSDLTDIVLTRNGFPVQNRLSSTYQLTQGVWQYEEITDFYFEFDYENREPGTYGLTGKYKGTPFSVYNKIIEAPISNEPADPSALNYVTWGYYTDRNDEPMKITELVFGFKGIQNAFYQSDLSDIKLFVNGVETPIKFRSDVFRYLEYDNRSGGDTSFNLIIIDGFTQSGNYVITGKYRGVDFTSYEIIIP